MARTGRKLKASVEENSSCTMSYNETEDGIPTHIQLNFQSDDGISAEELFDILAYFVHVHKDKPDDLFANGLDMDTTLQ